MLYLELRKQFLIAPKDFIILLIQCAYVMKLNTSLKVKVCAKATQWVAILYFSKLYNCYNIIMKILISIIKQL